MIKIKSSLYLSILLFLSLFPTTSSTFNYIQSALILPPKYSISETLHTLRPYCLTIPIHECVALEKYVLLSLTSGSVSQRGADSFSYEDTLGTPFIFASSQNHQNYQEKLQDSLSCAIFELNSPTTISDVIVVDTLKHTLNITNKQSISESVTNFCFLHNLNLKDCNVILTYFGDAAATNLRLRLINKCDLKHVKTGSNAIVNINTSSWSVQYNSGVVPNIELLNAISITIPFPQHLSIVSVPTSSRRETFRVCLQLKSHESVSVKEFNPSIVVRFRLDMYNKDSNIMIPTKKSEWESETAQRHGPWRLGTLLEQSIYIDLKSHTEFGTLGIVTCVAQIGMWVHTTEGKGTEIAWGKKVKSTFDVLPESLPQPRTPILQPLPIGDTSITPIPALRSHRYQHRLRLTHVTQLNVIDGQSHVLMRTALGLPAEDFDVVFVSANKFAPNSESVSKLIRGNIGVVHAPIVVDKDLLKQFLPSKTIESDTADSSKQSQQSMAIYAMIVALEKAVNTVMDRSKNNFTHSCEDLQPSFWRLLRPLTYALAGSDIVTFTNIASLSTQDVIIGLAAKCAGVSVVVCDPGNLNHALPTIKGVTAMIVPSYVAASHWAHIFDVHNIVNISIKVAQPGGSLAVPVLSNIERESDTFTIAFIGRLSQTKNPSIFIRVANEILTTLKSKNTESSYTLPHESYSGKKLQFWVIGDGLLRHVLEEMVVEFGIENDIIFKGSTPHQQVLKYLSKKQINLVLHTTLTNETFCLSNVEAMAAGVPVITYGVGGVADYLRKTNLNGTHLEQNDDQHGFVADSPTIQAMATAVLDLLAKGQNYLKIIEQNSMKYILSHGLLEMDMVKRFSNTYRSLVFGATLSRNIHLKIKTSAGTMFSKEAKSLQLKLIELNPKDSFQSSLALFERSVRLLRGVPFNEWYDKTRNLDKEEVNDIAKGMLQQRKDLILPGIIRSGKKKWVELQELNAPNGIPTPHGEGLWPGNFDARGNFYLTSLHKLKHDEDQLRFNVQHGLMPDVFLEVADNYTLLLDTLELKNGVMNVNSFVFLDTFALETVGTTYNWLNFRSHLPKIIDGTALHASTDFGMAEQEYYSGERAPGLTVVDDFLSPKALNDMLFFLQSSTIWFDVKNGYLGAYFNDGLSTPLLGQIEDELRVKMPNVIGNLSLNTVWAYKCSNTSPEGLAIHADMAAVNINLWLTPTDSNIELNDDESGGSGGLIVYLTRDEDLPKDWNFHAMNSFADSSIEKMYNFVKETKSQKIQIPYKQNRATIFHSRLFHESAKFKFKNDYKNSRINLTFLFGSPDLDKKFTTWDF
jgi:glycosyltransferase involved in cell wall biosynthesis